MLSDLIICWQYSIDDIWQQWYRGIQVESELIHMQDAVFEKKYFLLFLNGKQILILLHKMAFVFLYHTKAFGMWLFLKAHEIFYFKIGGNISKIVDSDMLFHFCYQ